MRKAIHTVTVIIGLLIASPTATCGQDSLRTEHVNADSALTLEECRRLAGENYPLVRRYGLIEKSAEYDLRNASKGYLPQVTLSGRASYQSESTELPFDLPGYGHIGLPKEQYQVSLEVQQTLWDGGDIRSRKEQTAASARVETERQRVDMYAVADRVEQLFFGILLIDEQLKQNALLQEELGRTYDKVTSYMNNGTANQSDLDAVSVEQINASQQQVELEASRTAYVQMLGAFIGKGLHPGTVLHRPTETDANRSSWGRGILPTVNRPELQWYEAQGRLADVQQSALKTGYMPRIGLFLQGAYGNPGLNMLKDKAGAWYMAGVRLSWNFGSLYTLKDSRRSLDNRKKQIEVARDVFLFNTRQEAVQHDNRVASLRRQMLNDDEIIRLRRNIRRAAEAKVENGTQTVTDLLTEINRESLALRTKALHEIELMMTVCKLSHTVNAWE